MFEQEFEKMAAIVWFDTRDAAYAYEEGIGEFKTGNNCLSMGEALTLIRRYDKALLGKHYKSKKNRLRAQRNSIVVAFGPEMVEMVGLARF